MHDALIYVLAVAIALLVGCVLRRGAKQYAESKVALAMLGVEKQLTTWAQGEYASGFEKRKKAIELVVDKIYPKLPVVVKMFVSVKALEAKIEYLYTEMLDLLDDGERNNSIK